MMYKSCLYMLTVPLVELQRWGPPPGAVERIGWWAGSTSPSTWGPCSRTETGRGKKRSTKHNYFHSTTLFIPHTFTTSLKHSDLHTCIHMHTYVRKSNKLQTDLTKLTSTFGMRAFRRLDITVRDSVRTATIRGDCAKTIALIKLALKCLFFV